MVELFEHQRAVLGLLKSGSILRGGVGSGKSITSLAYYFENVCGGRILGSDGFSDMTRPRDLYIITTAHKRDNHEWEEECSKFLLSTKEELSYWPVRVVIDSWNNIQKYVNIYSAFFIFDEHKAIGSGAWSKSFIQISKKNQWIILTATPGDNWMDYIPVFVANGFYKNRTEFMREHVVFDRFAKYPKVSYYVNVEKLIALKKKVLVEMQFSRKTVSHSEDVFVGYDTKKFNIVYKDRWNPFDEEPIRDAAQWCALQRRIVNSSPDRIRTTKEYARIHKRLIIFYTFDYELELLREMGKELQEEGYTVAELNGHKHMNVPEKGNWIYLVQYSSGAEGWNCLVTNAILFFSLSYSYKLMTQAAGRIDRLTTPYTDLNYIYLKSKSPIDRAIERSLSLKEDFNENRYFQTS